MAIAVTNKWTIPGFSKYFLIHTWNGNWGIVKKEKIKGGKVFLVKLTDTNKGKYKVCRLVDDSGERKLMYLHIAIMLVHKPKNGKLISFLSGYDLSLDNLVWSDTRMHQKTEHSIINSERGLMVDNIGNLSKRTGLTRAQVFNVICGQKIDGWRKTVDNSVFEKIGQLA